MFMLTLYMKQGEEREKERIRERGEERGAEREVGESREGDIGRQERDRERWEGEEGCEIQI